MFSIKNSPSSYKQPSADITKWPLPKPPDFHSHASKFTKYISSMTLEGDTLLQHKNGGMSLFLLSDNFCQQTISDNHTRNSKQNIITYLILSLKQTHIINIPQQKKIMKHSQYHSEFILLKIPPFLHQKYQNHMSKSIHT